MICETVKKGVDCIFMKKTGCSYNGGRCYPTVEQCNGCLRIVEYPAGLYCSAFTDPRVKWAKGSCNLATHLQKAIEKREKKLNPLKASKRRMANRG